MARHAKQVDQERTYPFSSIDALREAGLISLAVPKKYGGHGAGYKGNVVLLPLVLMELASWCSSTSQVIALHNSGVQLVHALGNEEQKAFFFNEVVQGHLFGSFGSEAGANRFKMNNTIQKTDNGYLLNGTKIFATGSPGAKWAIWRSVSIDSEGNQNENYMTPIVDLTSPGITVIDDWDGIGQRGTGSGKVVADDAFIPENHIAGEMGDYPLAEPFFNIQFHIHFAAQFVGIAKGALREATEYVKESARPWSDAKTAAEDPVTQLRIGDMAAKLAAAEQLVLHAAQLLQSYDLHPERRKAIEMAATHAKIIATETSLDVTNSIFQVMGARAATQGYNFDMYYRNARTLTLHDPVDRQRQLAGKFQLGIE